MVHLNVHFEGIMDRIIDDAIKKGLAKTKTEVLRMGLFELKNKYHLVEDDEDWEWTKEELKQLKKVLLKLKEDKESNYGTEEELWKALKRDTK